MIAPSSPDALLSRYRDGVYAYALRLTGCADDAADVTQEVLVRLWQRGPLTEPERLTAWVYRVAKNAALDLLRHRRARFTLSGASMPDDAPDPDAHADALAEGDALGRHLDAALRQLDEPYRSLVVLREIEGLAYADLADALDLPLTSVKVYLHRGRQRLRDVLRTMLPADELPTLARPALHHDARAL